MNINDILKKILEIQDLVNKKHTHSNKSVIDKITQSSLDSWSDKYTKNEVDNKINKVITDLDWKESVNTYADLSTTYPNAQDGWTVNVKDTDVTYRYSGSEWVSISANAIPLATSSVDGKMSKQDKINHDDMVSKKHTHSNKSVLDGITSALITAWNSAVTHIGDTVKHITSTERTLWNTVSNKFDKSGGTITGKVTIKGMAGSKPLNVRGINGITSEADSDDSLYLNLGTDKPVYINAETNEVYHKGNLTKISQLTNDKGFITSADVDTSQNHTHSNKTVLDGITSALITTWNNAYTHISDTIKHIVGRTIDGSFATAFRTQVKGNSSSGAFMQPIRNDTASVSNSPQYGTGIGFGMGDTHGYLYMNYSSSNAYIGAGNANKLNWTKELAFKDSNVASATKATQDSDGKQINTTYVKKGMTWNQLEGV